MKKLFCGLFSLMAAAAFMASPLSLMADCKHHHRHDCDDHSELHEFAGKYQISGFSNSFPGAPLGIESQAAVGKITLHHNGSVTVDFVDFTVVTIGGAVVSTHFVDVQGTYTVGPNSSEGLLTLFNFPSPGANPQFRLAFKKKDDCKVTGFSAVISVNTTSNLWTLLQAERIK